MTDSDYKKYIREIMIGLETLRRYGNWSVSPWLIKKYGLERVEEDLRMRAGKQYHIRTAIYKPMGEARTTKKYYIMEKEN